MIIAVIDQTSAGTFTRKQLEDTVWSIKYWALYQLNRTPWIEHSHVAGVDKVILVSSTAETSYHRDLEVEATAPPGAWNCYLTDVSDQPGALGYHNDAALKGTPHSLRGHAADTLLPQMHIFVHTAREDGVSATEVATHEVAEAVVDPQVEDESQIRKYLNPNTRQWWIGEVGDPVQGRGYDVGAPEGRPTGVPEGIVCDVAYPKLWGQDQRRAACSFTEDTEEWVDGKAPNSGLLPWSLASAGYMSVAPEAEPTNWSQIYGSDKARAAAAAQAYEGPLGS